MIFSRGDVPSRRVPGGRGRPLSFLFFSYAIFVKFPNCRAMNQAINCCHSAGMRAVFADFERDMLSERIKAGPWRQL